ncbi:hypothetical protein [Nannocystis pusilla]|uniref:hypothetical protein n=1 Tax=Nannocystis pusilla TaxID=889268 RepID=UPI003DA343A0
MPSESRGSRSFSSAGVREEEKTFRGLEDLVDVVVARHQPHADLRHLQHRGLLAQAGVDRVRVGEHRGREEVGRVEHGRYRNKLLRCQGDTARGDGNRKLR